MVYKFFSFTKSLNEPSVFSSVQPSLQAKTTRWPSNFTVRIASLWALCSLAGTNTAARQAATEAGIYQRRRCTATGLLSTIYCRLSSQTARRISLSKVLSSIGQRQLRSISPHFFISLSKFLFFISLLFFIYFFDFTSSTREPHRDGSNRKPCHPGNFGISKAVHRGTNYLTVRFAKRIDQLQQCRAVVGLHCWFGHRWRRRCRLVGIATLKRHDGVVGHTPHPGTLRTAPVEAAKVAPECAEYLVEEIFGLPRRAETVAAAHAPDKVAMPVYQFFE